MTESTRHTEHLPSGPGTDPERIAALLDGRLDERERAEVLAQLDASDDDFEAFVDALAVTRELEAEDAPAGGVTPLRPGVGRRWWRRPGGHWLALAAGVVGITLLPVFWSRARAPGFDDPGRYAALLRDERAGLPAEWDRNPWGVTRGPADALTPEARALRIGARVTDLQIALTAGDAAEASRLADEMAAMLADEPGATDTAGRYRELGRQLGEAPERGAPLVKVAHEELAATVDADFLALGAWAEAGRVAVAYLDAEFFRDPATREVLDHAAKMPDPSGSVPAAAERIRGAAGSEGEPDWKALDAGLTELLRAAGS